MVVYVTKVAAKVSSSSVFQYFATKMPQLEHQTADLARIDKVRTFAFASHI